VPAYTASKHGVAGLTKSARQRVGPLQRPGQCHRAGHFATDNTRALREDPVRSQEILSRIPAGRWGEPPDLAGAVIFLASSASDYVNGHILVVDGGWMAR